MARDAKEKLFEIDSKKIELDFLRQQFLVECKRYAAQCIEGKVRTAISANAEKALALGREGLLPIKTRVNQMIDKTSELVEEVINQDHLWRHSNETLSVKNFPRDHYRLNGNCGPGILDKAFKQVLTPVGTLLMEHELDTEKNWRPGPNGMVYRHPLHWSPEMLACITRYNDRFNELAGLVEAYEELSKQDSGSDALDLWDSI